MNEEFEVFLQGPGFAQILVKVPAQGKVRDFIEIAKANGLKLGEEKELEVWLENADEPLGLDASFKKAGVTHRCRIHVHTCRRVVVTVNYNGKSIEHPFSPSTTVGLVQTWAQKKFDLKGADATEHFLQVCDSTNKPSHDTQIGTFAKPRDCVVCFDLVPEVRIEG